MMKLIDANALMETYKGWLPQLTAEEDAGDRNGVETCIAVLEDAPTIDAIPMWWITEKFLDVLNKDEELSKAVWLVRKAWQKEQEGLDV